jgi:tetratricopeptide (TPR) repeat protein
MKRYLCFALLIAVAAGAAAGSTAAAEPQLHSFSNLTPATGFDAAALAPFKSAVCRPPSSRRPRRIARGKALKAGKTLLTKRTSRRAVRKLLANRSLRKPAEAQAVAMAAIGANKPGAGLAALLAALERHPKDAGLLASASALLTQVGRPAEGLALADAALKARAGRTAPMGIPIKAIALNNRGLALLALQRYRDAVAPLKAAIAQEPLLIEARRNLAVAYLCTGQDTQAATEYSQSIQRTPGLPTVPVTDAETGASLGTQTKADTVLDLTHGERGQLPQLKVPETAQDGAASAQTLDDLFRRRNQDSHDLLTQATNANSQVLTQLDQGAQFRYFQIHAMYGNWFGQRPDIAAQFAQFTAARQVLDNEFQDFWINRFPPIYGACVDKPTQAEEQNCFATDCRGAIESEHAKWLQNAKEADRLGHEWAAALWEYGTAVAANLGNQSAHDSVVFTMRSQVWGFYSVWVLQRVAAWAGAEKDASSCVNATGAAAAETDPGSEPFGLSCPPQINSLNLSINLGVIKVAVKCESISASTGLPGVVGPFASVGYTFGTGSTTAFVGLKSGIQDIPGFDVGVKGGIYMTWDKTGKPTDCGLRATASAGTVAPYDLGPSASGKLEYSLAGTFL